MPTYDYQCHSCHQDFTAVHKIADPAPHCPVCGGEARKKLSAPAVQGGGRKAEAGFQGHGCGGGTCGCKH